jgi:hypothetical protein
MEVHHHAGVEKKNFKEYFLEFLMIFLAVTMSFFAESLREHMVYQPREMGILSVLIFIAVVCIYHKEEDSSSYLYTSILLNQKNTNEIPVIPFTYRDWCLQPASKI